MNNNISFERCGEVLCGCGTPNNMRTDAMYCFKTSYHSYFLEIKKCDFEYNYFNIMENIIYAKNHHTLCHQKCLTCTPKIMCSAA